MPLYEMTHDFQARENRGVVFLSGELDVGTVRTARAVLQEAGRRTDGPLVIDLSALTFCDSSGVRVLLGAVLRAQSRPVVLRNPHGMAARCSTSPG